MIDYLDSQSRRPMPQSNRKRVQSITVMQMLIGRDVLGPKKSHQTKIMIEAADRYHKIMCPHERESHQTTHFANPRVQTSLNVSAIGRSQIDAIDDGKERVGLQRGLSPYFADVLNSIIIDNLTTKQTAEKLLSKADRTTENIVLERLRSALLHLAISHFRLR